MAGIDDTAVDPAGDPGRGLAAGDPHHGLVEQSQTLPDPPPPDPDPTLNVCGDCDQITVAALVTHPDRPPGSGERAGEIAIAELTLRLRDQQVPLLGAPRL